MGGARRSEPLRYAQDFAEWLRARLIAHDTAALIAYRDEAPEAARAHPSEEHFLPLHVSWGAAGNDPRVERIVGGFEAGALSLDSYAFHPLH
jgi:4,5-DOPA dioxygenase extradiol